MAPLVPGHPEALSASSRQLARQLGSEPTLGGFYLAGSAALALFLDHRPVRDLDLFSATNRLRPPDRRDLLQGVLSRPGPARVETARDGFLALRFPSDVRVRCYYYPYALAAPLEACEGLAVASAVDLGLMKLGALISRGARRDFVDLFLLCRQIPLSELLAAAADKYAHVGDFPLQTIKALADRSLARGEPDPPLRESLPWERVEQWAESQVRAWAERQGWPVAPSEGR